MSNSLRTLAASALFAASITSVASVGYAMPVSDGLAIKNAAPTTIEVVRWRGRGWGVGAGFLGGALIGGALAAPYYYGPYPGYYPGPYYPGPNYPAPAYYGGQVPGDAVAYCVQRFRSYDPQSGTYLGNDGARHRCP
jgi:BA14K-like protein